LFDSATFIADVSPVATCADAPTDTAARHSATAIAVIFMFVSGF
jgi:hypothetical protein